MKRLLVILFLIPSLALGAYTEFYCQSNGSNLNAGSTTGTAGDGTPKYSSAGGNWTNSTRTFTPTDGSNPSLSCAVGDFASVYVTVGATTAVYIGRLTTVTNATNGTLVLSGTAVVGTDPSNGTGTMTIKVGGAWLGPNAASNFPFGFGLSALVDTNGDGVRVNMKNDASYSLTSVVNFTAASGITVQGYTTTPGDLGKATLTSSATGAGGASNFVISQANNMWLDINWVNTGGSNQLTLVSSTGLNNLFVRNVFHGARNQGLVIASGTIFESEVYNNNVANVASSGGLFCNGSYVTVANCVIHDQANGSGIVNSTSAMTVVNSIIANNPGGGIATVSTALFTHLINNNIYNNTGDGFNNVVTVGEGPNLIVNNNFIKNSGKGINYTNAATTGLTYNNGYGSGTQANGAVDALASIQHTLTDVTYASGVTPWVAPATGNFSTNLAAAEGTGRGVFTETTNEVAPTPTPTASGTPTPYTGTIGYPDIGAAQANIGMVFPTPTSTPSSTSTPTATATASFTPCGATPTATATFTPSATFTPTATSTATFTPTATASSTFTPTPTSTVEVSYGFSN